MFTKGWGVSAGAGGYSRSNVEHFSAALVFAFALIPYVKLGPFGLPTEVQAWSPIFSWAAIFALFLRGGLKVHRFHAVLFLYGFIFLIYIPLSSDIEVQQYFRKSVAFLLCSGVAVVAAYASPRSMLRALKVFTVIWFFFAVLGEIKPDLYKSIVTVFIPGALGAFGDRGVTSLAPEATDFGFTMVYFWLIAIMSSHASIKMGCRGAPYWLYFLILLNILMSRSGSGVFGFVIVATVYFFFSDSYRSVVVTVLSRVFFLFGLLAAVLLLVVVGMEPETGYRGFDLLILAISNPAELIQTTFSYRVAHNLVGFFGFVDSFCLGYGSGSYTVEAINVYNKYRIDQILGVEGWYLSNIPNTLRDSPLAIFPVILFEYGALGVLFLLYIFRAVLQSQLGARYSVFALLFLTWSQSFPVAYPLFWFLLGLIRNPEFTCCQSRV